ncbi:laccase-7-like [Pyrus x bretschneideri]|uniref:laccase-7-like n=1 Tax=Pyrus x bretschneideri TaxID=225117 RepID=UPI00202F668B|nr:laccase-7-like [Pyrus x bretschneideri]
MARLVFLLACALTLLASSVASGAIVEHSFNVNNLTVSRLCRNQSITVVNGSYPGPTIYARDGDTLVVHVLNQSPYNITIHWHGIFQLLSAWADGPAYVTQCPIHPGQSFTYKFNITGQEGTLWWHAHVSWLRATVHGALIIHPKVGRSFPFPKPAKEVPILLGEWYNGNVVDIEEEGLATGIAPNGSNAYIINGLPGDLYDCSQNQTYQLNVVRGNTYLLRLINVALNNQLFFNIANHNMTVVAIDATYTTPYVTDVVVTGPGQTTDVLVKFNQPIGSYYMAATPYASANIGFDNTTTRGIIVYKNSKSSTPIMPPLPNPRDTPLAHKFYSNITGLAGGPQWVPVPLQVDERMFVTISVNLEVCPENATCQGPLFNRLSASMNNESFVLPSNTSMMEAQFNNVSGVYTRDFPNEPPIKFDYTDTNVSFDLSLIYAPKSTKVKTLKFNSTVEIVLQNTAFLAIENHPIHLHGFNFHVLAQGFGNYNPINDPKKFNFINPQIRNTIGVPVGGWAVIRFQANNPGIWYMHCHLDVHVPWGLGMAFEVENGPTPESTLPPPPLDLPKC